MARKGKKYVEICVPTLGKHTCVISIVKHDCNNNIFIQNNDDDDEENQVCAENYE